ncbi:uncharacterized protein BDZ99DRAFT_569774 [Mytilinidion resinicola]|uniref:Uncharacterized protein n=1 Tax=Mytilinidion resinicola TaxID=574789 RepID=A0A6A6YTV7_9PEZI|nr:uncharacterized protein BDZ99DRAFT_569774 [Mytilinidion resinicola]KAF2811813.1 hypothetical protein BDZ99DRAFT_569774 [Mytilinidion resinicola]
MALLLAPYNDSMRLGRGFNSYTQTMCIDQAVEIAQDDIISVRPDNPSQVVSYSSRFVDKLSEVVDTMNLSYGSSIKKGTIEISGNASTVDEDKIKSSDVNMIVSVKVVNQTTTLVDTCKFKPIQGVLPGSQKFNECFGDCFISGFIEGGDFTAICSTRVLDRSKVGKISASIKGNLNTSNNSDFTLDTLNIDSVDSWNSSDTETTISVSWMGGGQVKEATTLWDTKSLFVAAAAFPFQVAKCPQKTWAILTKYKQSRSFVEWSEKASFTPLEYDNIGSFTAELFDNFMQYKLLLKKVQTIMDNRDQYTVQTEKHNAISTEVPTLIAVRSALRTEMNKIVQAVDVLARDPGILKRQAQDSAVPLHPLVKSILLEAQYGRYGTSIPSDPAEQNVASLQVDVASSQPPTMTSPAQTSVLVDSPGVEPTPIVFTSGEGPEVPAAATGTPAKPETFNFGALVAPEIWVDLFPVPKTNATIMPSKTSDEIVPLTSGFPPPPSSDLKSEPAEPLPEVPKTTAPISEPPELPKLKVLAASWGIADVTQHMSRFIGADQTLTLDTGALSNSIPDPGWKTIRTLSILYKYSGGDASVDSRFGLLITTENKGIQKISPESMTQQSSVKMVGLSPRRPSGIYIIAIVWGGEVIDSPVVLEKIYTRTEQQQTFPVSNDFFGKDTWPGVVKSAQIYYQETEDGPVLSKLRAEAEPRCGVNAMQLF